MKIALYNLTTTTKHGGVESFVWEIGRELAERGHAVTLYGGRGTVSRPYDQLTIRQYPYIPRETWGKNPVLRKSLNLLKLLERLSMATRALPDLVRGGYDIIQVSKPYDFPIGARARNNRTRLLYNSQGTDFFPGDRFFRRAIDGAYACSSFNAAMVEGRLYIPIDVSYNGFDAARFRPLPADEALRLRLSPDGAPLVLYVGRLVTFKGLDHLLDAMALLQPVRQAAAVAHTQHDGQRARRSAAPRLLLAGDGPHREQLEQRARKLKIADRVLFIGPQPNAELPRYHAISDLFVLPSTDHETFGIGACEAMGCARPVVAARTGGLPEVVRHGETGLLVAPGDASALAEAIGALLDDEALRHRFGAAGYDWVREMFTWERVADRVLAKMTLDS